MRCRLEAVKMHLITKTLVDLKGKNVGAEENEGESDEIFEFRGCPLVEFEAADFIRNESRWIGDFGNRKRRQLFTNFDDETNLDILVEENLRQKRKQVRKQVQ